jgi:inhibitor of KinA
MDPMYETTAPEINPLGDAALLINWGNAISRELNEKVIALAKALRDKPFEGFVDCVPAYSSLTVLYDLYRVHKSTSDHVSSYDRVKDHVEQALQNHLTAGVNESTLIEVPVCYDESLGNDLAIISNVMQVEKAEIIALHTSSSYHVYMSGFIPGFVYMGEVDARIAIARKQSPVPVKPGAVGIAGIQTGIYPSESPGGWHIVGYTPYLLFDATNTDDPCLLHAGDTVQFVSVCIDDYHKMKKEIRHGN